MPCDHLQPEDVIERAEAWLGEHGTSDWRGVRVRHGENTPGGFWASVVMELERRDDQWVVTRLDRSRQPLPDAECGLNVQVAGRR